jgi:hypothetical protein
MAKKIINLGTADKGNGDPIRTAFSKVNENFTELYTALGLDSDGLNIGSFEFTDNILSTTDSSNIVIDQAVVINSELTMHGDIVPNIANEHTLGTLQRPWKSLYVSGSTIYLGGAALKIDNEGELTLNDNRIVQQNGQYIDLNSNVNDVNVSNPQPGDTLQWGPGFWINVPNSDNKLVNGAKEVVLTGGANPYVTFPTVASGENITIQGAEIASANGAVAITSSNSVVVNTNALTSLNTWTFGTDGDLQLPGGATLSSDTVNGFTISQLAIDEETTLSVNFRRTGEIIVPLSIQFNLLDTPTGFVGAQLDSLIIAGNPGKAIDIAPNDGANGTWSFGTDGNLQLPPGFITTNQVTGLNLRSGYDVHIISNHADVDHEWILDSYGDLTLPGGIKSEGAINIDINLTDSTLRRWTFTEGGDLQFPDATVQTTAYTGPGDNIVNGAYTLSVASTGPINLPTASTGLGRLQNADGIEILTNSGGTAKLWTFGASGELTVPGNIQAIASVGSDGGDLTVQAGETVTGTGGDLTLKSGETTTGNAGVLNVRAGNTVTGDGGMLNVRAGDAVTGNAGGIDLRAGDTITGDGGSIFITAGSAVNSGPGGSVTITSGDNVNNGAGNINLVAAASLSGADGVINLTTAIGSWTFNEAGNLTFPIGLIIEDFSGSPMIRAANGTAAVLGGAPALAGDGIIIQAGNAGADDGVDPMTGANGGGVVIAGGAGTGQSTGGTVTIFGGADANGDFADVTIGNGAGQFHFYGNGTLEFPDSTVQSTAWTGTLTINDSGLAINGGTGTIYQGPTGVLQVGDKKGGVYHAASTSSNGLFTFGMNGSGIMSAAVEGSLFVGNNLPSNNGGVTTAYGGWLVVENGGKFGTDVDTLGNVSIGKGVFEKFQAKQDATGTVEHDCLNGHIFYHTSPDANWTANFTNLNIATSYATSVTVVIAQGGTGYYPNAVQIGGVGQTINWQGNATPTPSSNRTDVVTFSILNNSGTYTVLGQLTGF